MPSKEKPSFFLRSGGRWRSEYSFVLVCGFLGAFGMPFVFFFVVCFFGSEVVH